MSEQLPDDPRDKSASDAPPPEQPPPRFNPLVFGVIAATIQMAIFLWLIYG